MKEVEYSDCPLEPHDSTCGERLSHCPALAFFQAQLLLRGTLQSAEFPHDPQAIVTTKGTFWEHSWTNFLQVNREQP